MNKLLRNNLRESAFIAIVSASIITASASPQKDQSFVTEVDAVPALLPEEAQPEATTVVDFMDELVLEEPVKKVVVWEDRDIEFSKRDLFCLQQNIYYEARGETILDQRAVAWVTLNRVEHETWPDTVCDVVWQPSQFSWTRHTLEEVPDFKNKIEQEAWSTSKKIARDVMAKFKMNFPDPTRGADHYHADYMRPYWADANKMTAQAGAHVFYKLY